MHMYQQDDDKREFLRVDHEKPLNFRELKANKLSNRSEVLARNVSASGLLFRTEQVPPALSSMLWVELDQKMISICSEIEEDLLIKNNGVLGRVVRIAEGEPSLSYDVGVCFLRKKDMSEEEVNTLMEN
ncbi:MAG: PilZ domain-containing protein [Candidatus Omnitrophica bacterium]|nr:PilZ domain-containing protein [Candidatus Omnitrophota bacterium]